MTTLYFLRHGDPVQTGLLLGSTDLALSEHGYRLMHDSCQGIRKNINLSCVYSSPMKRCLRFSKSYALDKGLPLSILEGIKEFDFGDFDGQDVHELWKSHPKLMDEFSRRPSLQILPNQESLNGFIKRVRIGLETMCRQHPNDNVLVVTHGGVIKAMLGIVKNINFETENIFSTQKIDYASMTIVDVGLPGFHQATVQLVNNQPLD